jgi:hypothetical protein
MSPSKKFYLEKDFTAVVYLSESQNPIPPHPLYLYTCIQYTYSHRKGEGGDLNQREAEMDNSSKSWVEIPT